MVLLTLVMYFMSQLRFLNSVHVLFYQSFKVIQPNLTDSTNTKNVFY